MQQLLALEPHQLWKNLLLTALLWAAAFGARELVRRTLRTRGLNLDEQRRFMASTRNVMLAVLAVGTVALWFQELRVFALSLAAVAAAVAISVKELIMCVGGSFLRTSSRSFEIGDRVEVGSVRGDVIDTALFTTTILEIGPGHVGHQRTGRAITLPNSVFFTQPVVNESFTETYVLHTFTVVAPNDETWALREKALLDAATEEMAPYAEESKAFFERMSRERAIETPTQEPRVLLQIDAPTTLKMICRLPAPARRKGRIEQAILRRYLTSTVASTASARRPETRA
jgi:small-conductance mechanosensitive channel